MPLKNHIFLMYCGNSSDNKEHRKWSRTEVRPLVQYDKDLQPDSFFPSFLLLALKSKHGNSLIPGFDAPGTKADWLAWLDDLFLPDYNLEALAVTVKETNLPPVDIWVALPYPDPEQKSFGWVNGLSLDLSQNKHRKKAVAWWIGRFLGRWQSDIVDKKMDAYVSLKGFYWGRESMTLKDRCLLPGLISHINKFGCHTLWIPYYAVTPLLRFLNPGFDVVIIQPSYLQNPTLGWQRLSEASKRAKNHRAGLEIEFDTSAQYINSRGYTIAIDYLNRGLPEFEGYMENSNLAYYTGYKTLINLCQADNPLYSDLYRFVKGTYKKVSYPDINY